MTNPLELRQKITDQIVKALEGDLIPWRRPWSLSLNAGRPANAISKKAYTGINPLLLQLHAMHHGFTSKWWATFDQITELGGSVRKRPADVEAGEWGCKIVFMKPVSKRTKNAATGEEKKEGFTVMRTYVVFNVDQVDGDKLDRFRVDTGNSTVADPNFAAAEELVAATGADIRQGGNAAFYHRPLPEGSFPNHTGGDFIQVPGRSQFPDQAYYFETLFHELAHFSECRLGWDHKKETYAMGELVAEISASMIAAELGIPQGEDLKNHAAYLKSWLAAMKGDPSFIFEASTQASKVTDFLLGFVKAGAGETEDVDAFAVSNAAMASGMATGL
jgi:antirestriction protein ArdC